jgi:CRP-like cAMP-binding protein
LPQNADGLSNRILLALPTTVRVEILHNCDSVEFVAGQLICAAGVRVHQAYFINSGLVSPIKVMRDGQSAEIAAVGSEGLLGLFASAYGADRALVNQVAQLPIKALRIDRRKLQNAIEKYPELRRVITRYLLLTTDLLEQISACNRLHSLEQRMCYWLLLLTDEVHSGGVHLTHDFLASMLGANRSSVSITANGLRSRQVIRYSHGKILVLDRKALEHTVCECYQARRQRIDLAYGPASKSVGPRSALLPR